MQLRSFAFVLLVCSIAAIEDEPKQPTIGYRSAPLLTVDGLTFKDLTRNGKLDPYEDWRLPADVRTADLVQRMSLEELAGVMVHGTLPSAGPLAPLGVGKEYDWVKVRQFIDKDHVNTFITRLNGSAEFFAKQNNEVQAIAESSRLGIPVIISSDPRHHFEQVDGAAKDGWDGHNYYGRFADFAGHNFPQHLIPFNGAFAAQVGGVMPTYPILQDVTIDGKPLEQVGAGFNRQLLGDMLRKQYDFRGVILCDWAITRDCPEACRNGASAGNKAAAQDIGMPWGVEDLTVAQRFAKAINAGVDQVGGTEQSQAIVEDVHNGSIPEARVREAAARILLQKFQLGLFEQPYVDEAKAATIAGDQEFVREGQAAQAKAVVE
jgi:beta-glucosidase-like glycosyl hydrolase